METLNEKYFRLIKQTLEEDETFAVDFVFEHDGKFYLVVWDGIKWSDPHCLIFRK